MTGATPQAGERHTLVVPDGGRRRADRFVADLTGLSRSFVQRLIAEGRLTLAGRSLRANTVLGPGDTVITKIGTQHSWRALGKTVSIWAVSKLTGRKRPGHLHR